MAKRRIAVITPPLNTSYILSKENGVEKTRLIHFTASPVLMNTPQIILMDAVSK